MAADIEAIAKTILSQTVVLANQAASSAAIAQQAAADTSDKAPINSPALTGAPTAPTASPGNNSTRIATTAYLDRLLNQPNGLPTLDGSGKIPSSQIPPQQITAVYVVASQAAMLALAAPIGASAIRTDLSNAQFILTALPASTLANWVQVGTSPVLSVAGLTGAITAADLTAELIPFVGDSGAGGTAGDVPAPAAGDAAAGKVLGASGGFIQVSVAKLAEGSTGTGAAARAGSPALTGTPTAPTAAVDTNTTQLATTAFVLGQASSSGDGTPAMDGVAARGTSTHFARADHVHPSDTSRAPLASPALTGAPSAPTPTVGDNSTAIATTAFVQTAVAGSASFSTGDIKATMKTAADAGWVLMNDGTIGDASSGGTTRANADTSALFTLLWNNCSNTACPVSGGRGASAAADFAAHKTIVLPLALGRALGAAGAGSGLTSRPLGSTIGAETVTLSTAELPHLSYTATFHYSDQTANAGSGPYVAFKDPTGVFLGEGVPDATSANTAVTVADSNGGGAHANMQPTLFVNWMIKL